MKKSAATNTYAFFALLSYIILVLASFCESSGNNNNDVLKQSRQPQNLHQHIDVREDGCPPPRSSAPNGQRFIGLNVHGRAKCLLWNHPKKSIDSTLRPLFSSTSKVEKIVDDGRQSQRSKSANQTADNNTKERKQLRIGSFFLPSSVYGTADYRFRKVRWYGIEKIGTIFRWDLPHPWSLCNGNDKDDRVDNSYPYKSRLFGFPTTLDVAAYRSISNPSKDGTRKEAHSMIDSGNLCIGWHKYDDRASFGDIGVNPRIQIGFDQQYSDSDDGLHMISKTKRKRHPFYFRFFLPLIRRRFDFQWTSRWGDLSSRLCSERNTETETDMEDHWSSDHRESNGDPWWIPQVNLDPSIGILTSENRHRKAFLGKDDRRYYTEFRFRLRTTMPTLLSSVTNNAMATYDEDDLEAASFRFEYSLLTSPGEQNRRFQGVARTTARFETIVVPSFWLRSVTETARFGLAHEQHHANIS